MNALFSQVNITFFDVVNILHDIINPLLVDKIVDSSKLKQIGDDILKCI